MEETATICPTYTTCKVNSIVTLSLAVVPKINFDFVLYLVYRCRSGEISRRKKVKFSGTCTYQSHCALGEKSQAIRKHTLFARMRVVRVEENESYNLLLLTRVQIELLSGE